MDADEHDAGASTSPPAFARRSLKKRLSKSVRLARHGDEQQDGSCHPPWSQAMCPACVTTLALAVAGTGSAGGLTALVVSKFRRKKSRDAQASASPASPSKEQP